MAQPWENFGAPDEKPEAATSTPTWESFGAPSETVSQQAPAQTPANTDPDKPADFDLAKDWQEHSKDVGFSDEFKKALGIGDPNSVMGKFNELATTPLLAAQYAMAGLGTAADTADAALSDLGYRTGLNKALGTNRLNPVNTVLDIGNAIGGEAGLINAPRATAALSDADIAGNVQNIIQKGGSADDVRAYVKSYGGDPAAIKGLDEAVAAHKAGQEFGTAVADNAVAKASETPGTTPVPDNSLAPQLGVETPPNNESAVQQQAVAETTKAIEGTPVEPVPEAVPAGDGAPVEPAPADTGDLFPESEPAATPEDQAPVDTPAEALQTYDDSERLNSLLKTIKPVGGTREQVIDYKIRQLEREADGATPDDAAAIQAEIHDYESIRGRARELDNGAGEDQRLSRAQLSEARDELKAAVLNSEITPEEAQARIETASKTGNTASAVDALDLDKTPTQSVKPLEEVTPEEADDATNRVTQQLQAYAQNRKEQEGLLATQRKAQASRLQAAIDAADGNDTENLIKMKEALKGKMETPDMPSIRDQLDPQDINALQARILNNKDLLPFEQLRSANAFKKILDGERLQPAEISLLQRSFPSQTLKTFLENSNELAATAPKGQGELFKQGETLSTGPIKELKPEEKPVDPDKYVLDKNQGDFFPDTREDPEKLFPNRPGDQVKPLKDRVKSNLIVEAANSLKSIKATLDLSAPGRQGLPLIMTREYWAALPKMVKQFGSEATFNAMQSQIKDSPNFERMQTGGLSITQVGDELSQREESFMSHLPEKIPGFGVLHKASERAYTGFLNQLRADTFDRIMSQAKTTGRDIDDPQFLKDTAKVINSLTGRGDLGKFNAVAPQLNTVFFSPRFLKSRLDMLNPAYYASLDPLARKEAIKGAVALGALNLTVLSLAHLGGAKVELDPRSSDFAKIRIHNPGGAAGAAMAAPGLVGVGVNTYNGDTRYDLGTGVQPVIRVLSQLASGYKKNQKGEIVKLNDKFGGPTYSDVVTSFVRSKLSPALGMAVDLKTGKDFTGQPVSIGKELGGALVPLSVSDAYEGYYPNSSSPQKAPVPQATDWVNFK